MAQEYAYQSPYNFSENRVIDGVELEGLEYVSAKDARLEVRSNGAIRYKMENWSTYSSFKAANQDPSNWTINSRGEREIGINTQIGSVAFTARKTISGKPAPTSIKMVRSNSLTKDGKEDQRFRRMIGGGNVNSSAKSIGKGFAIMAAFDLGMQAYEAYGSIDDYFTFDSNQKSLKSAQTDLSNYISEGLLDSELLNVEDLSNLLNVIFQGESKSNDPNILKTGLSIYNRYQEISYETRQLGKKLQEDVDEQMKNPKRKN